MKTIQEASTEVRECGWGSVFCEAVWYDVVSALIQDDDVVVFTKPSDIVVLDENIAGFACDGWCDG